MRKWVVQLSLAAIAALSFQVRAQADFFSGFIYSVHEGGEREKVEAISFTADSHGHLRSGSGLGGVVSPEGSITFTSPHPAYPFANGLLSNGVIRAMAAYSRPERGQHAVMLEAAATSPELSDTQTLYGRVQRVLPQQGVRDMNRVRYADGEFFAVGPLGAFATSDNGVDWFRAGLPTGDDLLDVAKSGQRYVVATDRGSILTSTNSLVWTSASISTNAISAVAQGNNTFVAVDHRGFIFRSPDGVIWSAYGAPIWQQTNAHAIFPLSVASEPGPKLDFLNNRFVLWAKDRVSTSVDGLNWEDSNLVGISPPRGIHQTPMAYGNGRYVFVNGAQSAASVERTSWTIQRHLPSALLSRQASPFLLTFAEGKFWSVSSEAFQSSTDGTNWVVMRQKSHYAARSFVHGEGMFVVVGDQSYQSQDGVHWHLGERNFHAPLPDEGFPIVTGTDPVTTTWSFVNKGFYSTDPMQGPVTEANVNAHVQLGPLRLWVGDEGYVYYAREGVAPNFGVLPSLTTNDLMAAAGSQADEIGLIVGKNGTVLRVSDDPDGPLITLLPRVTTNDLVSAAYHPPFNGFQGGVVMVGENGSIFFSPAPQFTTLIPARSPTTTFLRTVAPPSYTPTPAAGIFIAAGDDGTILFSSNGMDWNSAETGSTNDFVRLGVRGPRGLFGLVAQQADGTLSYSPDGRVWTNLPLSATEATPYYGDTLEPGHVQGLALGDGVLVAVGSGFTGVSSDMRQWGYTRKNAAYEAVAYGNGVWVAVGLNGRIDSSQDGASWVNRSAPIGAQLLAVTYAAGKFVAVGDWGVILVSADGADWENKSLNQTVTLTDVEYANGMFMAIGGGKAVVSTDAGQTWQAHTGPSHATRLEWGNGRFVAIGSSSVSISLSGADWEILELPVYPDIQTRLKLQDIEFYDGTFYGVSQRKQRLYTSTTGTNWQQVLTGINHHPSGDIASSAMAAGNGLLYIAAAREIFTIALEDTGSPLFIEQPIDQSGGSGATLTLEATIADDSNARFQWFKNGIAIPGANSSTLTLTNAQRLSSGEYVLAASNDLGSRQSMGAQVLINAPQIQSLDAWAHYNAVNGRLDSDDDIDGIPALAEYLLGSDPHAPGEEAKPTFILLNDDNQTIPAIQFTRRKSPTGASVRVRATRVLDGNVDVSVAHNIEDLGNGLERVTAVPNTTLNGVEKLFFTIEGSTTSQ